MTLNDAALISQIAAAILVAASLFFVGVQIRQNTMAVKASMSQAHAAMYLDLNAMIVGDPEFAALRVTGLDRPEALAPSERARFVAFLSALFRFYEASRVQWRKGTLDPELWYFVERHLQTFRGLKGVEFWWKMRRDWHSAEFRAFVDALVPAPAGSIYDAPGQA